MTNWYASDSRSATKVYVVSMRRSERAATVAPPPPAVAVTAPSGAACGGAAVSSPGARELKTRARAGAALLRGA